MSKRKLLVVIILTLTCISIVSNPFVDAQSDFMVIFEGDLTESNVKWSSDSTKLIFQQGTFHEGNPDYGVISHRMTWYVFSTNDKKIIQTDTWPLQPYLSLEQIDIYSVATLDDQISFLFPSPNARYLIYAAERPDDWTQYYPLGIVDLQTREHQVLEDIVVTDLEEFTWNYDVSWSEDSSSALVRTSGLDQLPFYISGLESGLEAISYVSLYREGVNIGDEDVLAWDAFDISDNGEWLLLANLDQNGNRLFLWNATEPSDSQVIHSGRVLDAAFVVNNENQILYVDREEGLYTFDLVSKESELLLSFDGLEEEPLKAWISPDVSFVVLATFPGSAPDRLYLIELSTIKS